MIKSCKTFFQVFVFFILCIGYHQRACADDVTKVFLDRNRLEEIKDFSLLPAELNREMLEQLPHTFISMKADKYTIIPHKGHVYALREGYFDVFIWNDSIWENLYTSYYHGYNFGNLFYVKNDTFFSMGSYGYYLAHSNLLQFDNKIGSWDMDITKNKPESYYSRCLGVKGDTLLSIFGSIKDESIGKFEACKNAYLLNLKTNEWTELVPSQDLNIRYNTWGGTALDLKDFIILENELNAISGIIMVNKTDFSVKIFRQEGAIFNSSPIFCVNGNTFSYINTKGSIETADMDEKAKKSALLGYFAKPKPSLFTQWYFYMSLIFVISGIILFVLWLKRLYIQKRDAKSYQELELNVMPLIATLLAKKGMPIDTVELDLMLGIELLEYDNRRSRRAKMINDININYTKRFGSDLILRKKSEGDKRFMSYEIIDISTLQ